MNIRKSIECDLLEERKLIRGKGWYVRDSTYPSRYIVYSSFLKITRHIYISLRLDSKILVYTMKGFELAKRIATTLEERGCREVELVLHPPLCNVDIGEE